MQKLKTKEFWIGLLAFVIGLVGIAVVIMQICNVNRVGSKFWSQAEAYTGDAVPSGYSYLTYYTNITLLLFCFYAIVKFVAILCDIKKLKEGLNNRYLLMFLAVNELLVMIVYVTMMFVFNFQTFKYAPTPHNFHDIGVSMYKHFFVTIFAAVYCFSLIKKDKKRVELKKCLWFILYPVFYYILVQIIGRTCYEYDWFPYPFFATKQIWLNLFGSLDSFNFSKAFGLLFACGVVILTIYILAIVICCAICRRLQQNQRSRMIKEVRDAKAKN